MDKFHVLYCVVCVCFIAISSTTTDPTNQNNNARDSLPIINPRLFKNTTKPKELIPTELYALFGATDLIEATVNGKRYYYMTSGWDIFWFDDIFIPKHHFSFDTFVLSNLNLEFIEDSLFLNTYYSSDDGASGFIFKYSYTLNSNIDTGYRGIFYNLPPADIIVFNKTLSIVDTFQNINTNSFLTLFENKIYIQNGTSICVVDIQTKTILKYIPLLCQLYNGRFSIDGNGNIVYACPNEKTINLISSNGTRIGQPIPVHDIHGNGPQFASLDSKGRIIVGTQSSLQLFF